MLIDTHAHLWFDDYKDDLEEVLTRAQDAGVEKMIIPGTDLDSSRKAMELAKKYPGIIYAAVGIHPEELLNTDQDSPGLADARLNISASSRDLLSGRVLWGEESTREVVAIGEIGTDASTEELRACMGEQKELFREQCLIATERDLPVIIHTRDSFEETWEVLSSLPSMPKGQFHCFSVDENALKIVVDNGFYVSFCGNITWSKRVARLVSLVPDNRLLLETDSPFMLPRINGRVAPSSATREQPSESQNRNEPANVRVLAEKIAELRSQTLEEIEKLTTANANGLYRL